jgi:hypothetical protein
VGAAKSFALDKANAPDGATAFRIKRIGGDHVIEGKLDGVGADSAVLAHR